VVGIATSCIINKKYTLNPSKRIQLLKAGYDEISTVVKSAEDKVEINPRVKPSNKIMFAENKALLSFLIERKTIATN
jgi:hypothetical protein